MSERSSDHAFQYGNLTVTFTYPFDWVLEPRPVGPIIYASRDFPRDPFKDRIYFEAKRLENTNLESIESNFKEWAADEFSGYEYKGTDVTTVDGLPGYIINFNYRSSWGQMTTKNLLTEKNGYALRVYLDAQQNPQYLPKYITVFNTLLRTIKLTLNT